jgi:phosphatidylglycerol:prolipoprotein diacylglycerol transferase
VRREASRRRKASSGAAEVHLESPNDKAGRERRAVFPYIPQPTLDLGFYQLEAFSLLVVAAIVVQFQIVMRKAPGRGIDRRTASSLVGWAIGLGLVFAHVFDVVAYTPEKLLENPLVLLEVWGSLSSFGGMLGGLLGLYVVMRRRRMSAGDMWRFFDVLIYALPFTLAVGRLGCALQHDHPGVSSNHWLAVQFPDGPRFDLGLLEFLYVSLVAALFAWLGRRPRADGFYVGLFFLLYCPVRFMMDALRVSEARYAGWTPGQYLSIVAACGGAAVLVFVLRKGARRVSSSPPSAA